MRPFFVAGLEPTLKGSFIRGSDWLADNSAVNVISPIAALRQRGPAPPWRRLCVGLLLTGLLLMGLAPPGAWASDKLDHEKARAAVEAGQVLPLSTLLERLRRTHPGQVLELELERDDGRWIYEVKLLQANGQLLKLEVDAATAQVLQVKRRAVRDPGREVEPAKEPAK
jgi:hypothetical protein